ncbi:MAG: SH3 domain-containing protein, partial [Deltaproteobacteria bacterium]
MNSAWIRSAARVLLVSAFMVGGAGCAAEGLGEVGGESLQGADESSVAVAEITASYPIGSTVATTANLNLRTGPSTSDHILLVMPSGARAVTVQYTAPQNGFYKVRYGSSEGFAYGGYLRLVAAAGG